MNRKKRITNEDVAYVNACQKRSTPKEILKQVKRDIAEAMLAYLRFQDDIDARMRRIGQSMTNNNGRSIVEMLGVLAIIGVLSAGALKGYSDAMFKYKMNRTIDIFSQVLQRFMELEQKGIGNGNYISTPQDIIKYGLLPECQINSGYCRLPIGTFYTELFQNPRRGYINGNFIVSFTSSKECVAFASAHWENAVPQEWFIGENSDASIYIRTDDNGYPLYDPNGAYGDVKTTTTMADITEACKTCDGAEDGCSFYIVAYSEN